MIDAIRNGDEVAFAEVYEQHRAKVYGYLLKKTRSPEDARDLLQTVFLRLWKYRASLSTEFLLEQQLFTIARSVFIDHLRKASKIARMEEQSARQYAANPSHTYTSTLFDLRAQMGNALATMPEIRKKVFELNRLQGYTYQEIAEQLSISVKSVDNNLTKALRQLRKMMLLATVVIGLLGL